jgi:hypothetical protein
MFPNSVILTKAALLTSKSMSPIDSIALLVSSQLDISTHIISIDGYYEIILTFKIITQILKKYNPKISSSQIIVEFYFFSELFKSSFKLNLNIFKFSKN